MGMDVKWKGRALNTYPQQVPKERAEVVSTRQNCKTRRVLWGGKLEDWVGV